MFHVVKLLFADSETLICVFKAMVDEDRLLSRLGLLENQLSVYAKARTYVLANSSSSQFFCKAPL